MTTEIRSMRAWLTAVLLAGAVVALPVVAAETAAGDGVKVGEKSRVANLVSAEKLERQAAGEYAQLLREAASRGALGPENHPQVQRLRRIAAELIPNATRFNPRAAQWKWEVNLIGSKQVNAFCMPGGKICLLYTSPSPRD